MQVEQIMNKDVKMIESKSYVDEAARKMKTFDIGFLPVHENGKVVGAITDRDIAIRCVAEDMDPRETRVSQTMTSHVFCCYQDQDIQQAAQLMEENQIHRLIVLDRQDQIAGVLSTRDFAIKAGNEHLTFEVFERICESAQA